MVGALSQPELAELIAAVNRQPASGQADVQREDAMKGIESKQGRPAEGAER